MITITDAARDKILLFIKENLAIKDKEHARLRIGVIGGGCSGFQYTMQIEPIDDIEYGDVMIINGVCVSIDPKSALYIAGATLDYVEELMHAGFKIDNPNATRTCGCGQSFS